MQNRCIVSVVRTICLKINLDAPGTTIWTHPTELLDDMGHMESRFILFGDSVSFGAR